MNLAISYIIINALHTTPTTITKKIQYFLKLLSQIWETYKKINVLNPQFPAMFWLSTASLYANRNINLYVHNNVNDSTTNFA